MTPDQRAVLLRERFAKISPHAGNHWVPKGPRKPKEPEAPKKPRRLDFSLVGSRHTEVPVKWAKKPNEPKKLTVEPLKVSHGPLPLTVISEKLQPGSPHLAMRRRA